MPAILRCFRIAGFLFSKEGCYITQNEVNAVFDEQVRLCADTLKRKTKEYTGDDPDRLGAFKAAAALQHTTPQRALAGMLAKHIVSLYDMCFAEEVVYPMDTWDEKITDSLNYLLWQIAYSELYFSDVYWPDFSEDDLHRAIQSYQQRQRRYGKTEEQVENEK